jgi:quinolinate synthase
VVIHPEARASCWIEADFVSSTSKMVQIAEEHDELIIGTERGLVDRLKQRFPEKTLIPLSGAAICGNMKMNTLAKLAWSLDHMRHEIVLDEEVRSRAEGRCGGCWSFPGAGARRRRRMTRLLWYCSVNEGHAASMPS